MSANNPRVSKERGHSCPPEESDALEGGQECPRSFGSTAQPAGTRAGTSQRDVPTFDECVILLHGYGRTACSMLGVQWHLRRTGYRIINVNYPALRLSVEELADRFLHRVLLDHRVSSMGKVHFVTHSLGGIIVRQYLSNHSLENLGRVVMLAPPNHGSAIVDRLRRSALIRRLTGRSRLQLGTSPDELPQRLGPVRFDCSIIAGNRSLNPFLSRYLRGPNDGKVTVESARLDGMRDFLKVRSSHTWMMWRRSIIRQAIRFLRDGAFDHRVQTGG